jgi:hypothetical protein
MCSGRCPRGALEVVEEEMGEWRVGIGRTGRELEVRFALKDRRVAQQASSVLRIARKEAKRFGIESVVVDLASAEEPLVAAMVDQGLELLRSGR